jgi:cyanophycin synthetase
MQEDNPRVTAHCEEGGWAAIIEKGYFTICKGEWRIRVAKVNEVPLTINGSATCMIKNILPSILAASISDIDPKRIRKALQSFVPGPEQTPGRMNIFKIRDFKVMIDYVHNTDGFLQLTEFMKQVNANEKVGIIGCAGDRRDEDIKTMGKLAAKIFDKIIIRHDKDGRGRSNDELTQLITEGIRSEKPGVAIQIISDELEALQYAIEHAVKGSFIVNSSEDIQGCLDLISSQKKDLSQPAEIIKTYQDI